MGRSVWEDQTEVKWYRHNLSSIMHGGVGLCSKMRNQAKLSKLPNAQLYQLSVPAYQVSMQTVIAFQMLFKNFVLQLSRWILASMYKITVLFPQFLNEPLYQCTKWKSIILCIQQTGSTQLANHLSITLFLESYWSVFHSVYFYWHLIISLSIMTS